jgi:regulator of protease activity HflC (stomatin/prohibitin superfamily)
MKKTIKNFKIKNMSVDKVLNFILLLFIVLIVIFKNNETNKLEKQINEMSLKEDTLFTNYNKLLNNYETHDSVLNLSINNRKQNVYVTNKIIYENEKKDIVNLSDYRTDSLFKSNLKWAYARYFYLFNEN